MCEVCPVRNLLKLVLEETIWENHLRDEVVGVAAQDVAAPSTWRSLDFEAFLRARFLGRAPCAIRKQTQAQRATRAGTWRRPAMPRLLSGENLSTRHVPQEAVGKEGGQESTVGDVVRRFAARTMSQQLVPTTMAATAERTRFRPMVTSAFFCVSTSARPNRLWPTLGWRISTTVFHEIGNGSNAPHFLPQALVPRTLHGGKKTRVGPSGWPFLSRGDGWPFLVRVGVGPSFTGLRFFLLVVDVGPLVSK